MSKKVAIVVRAGSLHFRDYVFEQDIITIGRRPDNDIFLKHDSISGAHARIDLRTMTVTDLESTNGTFYRGQQVAAARFQFGKPITIEPYHIIVSDQLPDLPAKHSDTLVLSPAEMAAYTAGATDVDIGMVAPSASSESSTSSRWLAGIPQWIPVVVLSVAIGVAILLVGLAIWGNS